ncbi:MAG TPA: helix-turn-helix domain-containing protein [Ruminiclostridium sp.]|nr:helix-turn-helix domain-containing protein [Ruminiclostridium sp.]
MFCRPQCSSKTPMRTNVVFFPTAAKASDAGFRPCKKCRPDYTSFEPDLDLVNKAMEIFNAEFDTSIDFNCISKQLGVSTNHLIRLFKQHKGLTPNQYISGLRIDRAVELLKEKQVTILDAAYMTGFKTLSNFYRCFRIQKGCSPNEYRKNRSG